MSPLHRILRHSKRGQLICPICNEAVSLENSATDEDGKATHEDCYVRKICGMSDSQSIGHAKKTGTAD